LVQAFPSVVQGVDPLANESAGHVAAPLQNSATSHSPLEARHLTDVEANPSAGHVAEAPLQVSATSQIPEADRQVFPELNEFAGHVADVPVQVSTASQAPAEERQTVAALAKQLSAASLQELPQIPPPVHGLPECTLQVPPAQLSVPLQNSPSLQGPALATAWHWPFCGLHVPVLQASFRSEQSFGPPLHTPASHSSSTVHLS